MPGEPEQTNPSGAPTTGIQVADYLRAHPDFIARRPELWSVLAPPRRTLGDGVADLQSAMIERLRTDVQRLESLADSLTQQAREHRSLAAQVHKAAIALVAAQDFAMLIEVVTTDLAALLGVDVAVLAVEADPFACARHDVAGVRCVPAGTIADVFSDDGGIVIIGDGPADIRIFGAASGLVRSRAMIRLGGDRGLPVGLLAVGTRTAQRFQPGRGADVLRFLARILEHCLRTRLNLPC